MTRPDWIETLRDEVRPADPDPVLLAQLAQLSASSTAPSARPGRSAGARLAIVLGGAIAVGATSWAAGALPGTESPFRPEERITQQPTDPQPGGVRTPPSDAPTPPAGDPAPSDPAGGESDPGTTPTDPDGTGVPSGRPSGGSTSPSNSDPPGGEVELPELPTLPVPTVVPSVPEPSGLDGVPDLPAVPSIGVGRTSTEPTPPDSDSGAHRSPRPQEALVDRTR